MLRIMNDHKNINKTEMKIITYINQINIIKRY